METLETTISTDELAILRNPIRTLTTLGYGSVNLTVREGRVVEIQKVEKIRESEAKGVWARETRNGF